MDVDDLIYEYSLGLLNLHLLKVGLKKLNAKITILEIYSYSGASNYDNQAIIKTGNKIRYFKTIFIDKIKYKLLITQTIK